MAKQKTAAPTKSGLTVARNGNYIVLTWTPVKNCTDQDLAIYVNDSLVGKVHNLTASQQKYTYTITRANYYPNKNGTKYRPYLKEVAFRLSQTQKNKTQSNFSEQKEFKIYAPGQPKYIAPQMDSTNSNVFTYSWDRKSSDGDSTTSHYLFTKFYWETCLVSEGAAAKWSLVGSQKITIIDPTSHSTLTNQNSYGNKTISATSVTIVEREQDIAARKTRYFRVRSVGPGGLSDYRVYSHHLGGYRYPVTIKKEKTNYIGSSDSRGTTGTIPFDFASGWANDTVQIQYGIVEPGVNVTTDTRNNIVKSSLYLPSSFNSWTTLDTFKSTGKIDQYAYKIPERVTNNTRLFMRINRIHDNVTTYGYACLMNNKIVNKKATVSIGSLSKPVLNSININEGTKTVTVSVTNTTNIEGSFTAVYQNVNGVNTIIGILPYSSSTGTFLGNWSNITPKFGIRSYIANYSPIDPNPSSITKYRISNVLMSSGLVWQSDLISKPPEITEISKYDNETAYIAWKWTWDQADSAEISWSDNPIAWESTESPSSYMVTNTGDGHRYITGLGIGTYYFRVRFIATSGETVTYGTYSDTVELLMSAAPTTPTLTLSDEDGVVALTDQVTAYWQYSSNDGTPQSYAEFAEAARDSDDSPWVYTPIKSLDVNTDTHVAFTPEELGWENDTSHYICVRVTSASGERSDGWSDPVQITVAPKPVMSISGIGGENDAIVPVNDQEEAYIYKLTRLPIDFTVDGFGADGYCSVVIERASTYEITRPDDTHITGFNGETIISRIFEPEDEADGFANISIGVDDLLGRIDNTAQYRMIVSITDRYGQTDSVEYPFTVMWDYFAQMPSADISIDSENDIAIITPSAAQLIEEGDYCQIYRMSSDKPQLILDHGTFGETYVDIYPTFGRFGGYRIVYITKYGDYKTSDNRIAMTEYSNVGNDESISIYDKFLVSLRFDNNVVEFPGNISLNNSWAKDFRTTKYLGGSIQGDWNLGVQRSGTINGTIPIEHESETLYGLRFLADYAGICHVRTPEGSNFYADVQVKDDREEKWVNRISKISLSYTKVDSVETGMMTYEEWQNNPE